MIICSCNVISDHAIRDVVTSTEMALCSAAQVYDCLGCVVQCGLCSRSVKSILDERPAGCVAQASCAAEADSIAHALAAHTVTNLPAP
jgi:bacterioferritin-associated ferredoxin